MARVSFAAAAAQATEEAVVSPTDNKDVSLAVAPKTETALAVHRTGGDDLSADISRQDIKLPRLNLVGRTSELSNVFSPGSYVISQEAAISDGKTPLTVIANRVRKQYQTNLDWDTEGRDDLMQTVDTIEEVKALGGTITNQKGENCWAAIAHVEWLIEKPENLDEEAALKFFVAADGKDHAHVIQTVSGSAYSAIAVGLITARTAGHLKELGFKGGKWKLTSTFKTSGKFSWWLPVLRPAGLTSEAFRADLETL